MKRYIKVIVLLAVVAAALLGTGMYFFLRESGAEKQEEIFFEQQIELYNRIRPQKTQMILDGNANSNDQTSEQEGYLDDCLMVNSQTVAWLTIPDTVIDFPVAQCEDNSYYLTHNLEREESVYGVPFLDYRCNSDFSDFQSVIYGHNIRGERMFAQLLHFQEEDFFQQHDIGYLITNQQTYMIHWFACLIVENNDFIYHTVFLTNDEKAMFLKKVEQEAIQYQKIDAMYLQSKHLVTLSTCSYEFHEARTVVIGYLEP